MPKYLIQANYVGEGLTGLLKEGGTNRRAAVEEAAKSVGGSVDAFYYAFGGTDVFADAFYYAFGGTDVFAIIDMPDNATTAGLALTIGATGKVEMTTTVLLTPEEIDQATKKSPGYRSPGQ
jgi:uncharacterized protein with GYD domain